MVLGIVAGIGAVLAGVGILKGGHDVGSAAQRAGGAADRVGVAAERSALTFERVGKEAEVTLQKVRKEMTQIRQFLTETAWPEVNKTVSQFHKVLGKADALLDTSNFTVRVLAVLFALCAAYVVFKLISGRQPLNLRQRRHLTATFENLVLQIIYYLCLVIALVLVLHLVTEVLNFQWPHSIPIIFLIPSLTTLAIVYEYFISILKLIYTLLRFIPYIVLEFPADMISSPVRMGSGYMNTILPLQIGMCLVYLILYSFVPYTAYYLFEYLSASETSIIKRLLFGYMVYYGATLVICVIGTLFISRIIRPIWAFVARRNLTR